jgi:MFS family permease
MKVHMTALRRIETAPAKAGIYHGWLVVGAAFLIAFFGWGIGFYGPGIYLVALHDRHGWPTIEISSAITVYYLLGATLIPFTGSLFERFGARRAVSAGAAAMACGALLLTLVSQRWQVYAAFAVMSFGWAAMSGAAINIVIAPWFDERRGLAVSLALNGASAGGIVVAPLLVFLIGRFGFTVALSCAAALMLATVLPTATLILRNKRPGEHDAMGKSYDRLRTPAAGPTPVQPWQPALVLRSWRFQTICLPFALGLMVQVGFLTHQVAYLSPILGPAATAWAVSLTTSSAVVGRPSHRPVCRQARQAGSRKRKLPRSAGRNGTAGRESVGDDAVSGVHSVRPRPRKSDLASGAHRSA